VRKYFNNLNIIIIFSVFFSSEIGYAQLGFCQGNSGDPIFTETFGAGLTDVQLPPGTTTYIYANGGDPDDGIYTVSSNTDYFDWFDTEDHTPDDVNGRMLVVNSDFSSGEFYRTTINGLCENTSYEFSSWILNLAPSGGFCGAGVIPVNVRFEIWDNTDTNLLATGDTGNIGSSPTPTWLQYALVFQTVPSQTSVILKMINNGTGGCGNDLAIDDIVFKSCGDFIAVEDPSNNTSISLCSSETPYNSTLTAIPDNTVFSNHFYQWQDSTDGNVWADINGETGQTLSVTAITSTMYYRAKVAEFASNLNNEDCITFSDVYELFVVQAPSQPSVECWETVTFNSATCSWDISGSQPIEPTLECWETAIFNDVSCSWDISGSQPVQPLLECWETATFNSASCSWEIIGTQPSEPTNLECWETAIFDTNSCSWEVTGIQPSEPTALECWETTTFNFTTCSWDIIGTQIIDTVEVFLTICENEDLILEANTDISNATYQWNSGEMTSSITVNTPGTYIVVSTDGCSTVEKTIHVEFPEIPIIESVQSDGNDIVVFTSNSGDFLYSIDGSNFQTSNIFFDVAGGKYDIYVKSSLCDTLVTTSYLHFFIPKFFTPNNDGTNDTFNLSGIECFTSSEVYIFNRYGKLLFSAYNTSVNWQGTYRNKPLPVSDYWYLVIIEDQEFKGHFTLKR